MILTSTDFPAPLSPTRATTSPGYTLMETSLKACTAPNRLPIPVSVSTGSLPVAMVVTLFENWAGGKHGGQATCMARPPGASSAQADLGASIGEIARADVFDLVETIRDDRVVDVVCRHDDRIEDEGLDALVVGRAGDVFAGHQLHRNLGGLVGFDLDRLVDRHVLIAGDDALDRGQFCVLSGDRRKVLHTSRTKRGDDAACLTVVGRIHAGQIRRIDIIELAARELLRVFRTPVRVVVLCGHLQATRVDRREWPE